jgi:hypothetical protein
MTHTTTNPATLAAPAEPANAVVCDDAKLILDRAEDAVREIEYWAGEINDCMTELAGLEDLPEDVESLAVDVGDEAGDLSNSLGDRLERLRKVIAAATAE